ncbi:MAG: hypothetical protein LUC88_04695 [Prevotella sp.]|nr:hypothetical protein [Prevotella sp.]
MKRLDFTPKALEMLSDFCGDHGDLLYDKRELIESVIDYVVHQEIADIPEESEKAELFDMVCNLRMMSMDLKKIWREMI